MASSSEKLRQDYPWIQAPLVAGAPMRLIALAPLAVEISKAGGLGFIGAGSDVSKLDEYFQDAQRLLSGHDLQTQNNTLPVGVGFLNWGADIEAVVPLIEQYRPAAVWFFAPRRMQDLSGWTLRTRNATNGATKIWIQIGTVAEALEAAELCSPDVLVVQGGDAGGHGLNESASVMSLLPEVADALAQKLGDNSRSPVLVAAGGIADGRGVAASLALGAAGVVLGTRYLAAPEANIARGYRDEVLRACDGGPNTVRSSVYDKLRGTTDWPKQYGGRGVINQSYIDAQAGMDERENKSKYEEAMKAGDSGWGPQQRMTTYAGTAVGLVKNTQPAAEITREVREEALRVAGQLSGFLSINSP